MFIEIINVAHAGVISDAPSLTEVGMNILNFLLSVFGVIAIIMLVISGSMYFFSTGDEKAMNKAKQAAKYSVLGVIMAMSGMILVNLIGQFFN